MNHSDLLAALTSVCQKCLEKTAFTTLTDDQKYSGHRTYRQIHTHASAIAGQLQACFHERGKVLLAFTPGLEAVEAFLGCLYAGCVIIPVALEGLDDFEAAWPEIMEQLKPDLILTVGKAEEIQVWKEPVINFSQIALEAVANWQEPALASEDPLLISWCATSKRVGVPVTCQDIVDRCLILSAKNVVGNDDIVVASLDWEDPFSWVAGVIWPMFQGANSYFLPLRALQQNPYLWPAAISRYRAMCGVAPELLYQLCTETVGEEQKSRLDLVCWRMLIGIGEATSNQTLQVFKAAFAMCGLYGEPAMVVDGFLFQAQSVELPAVAEKPVAEQTVPFAELDLVAKQRRLTEMLPGMVAEALGVNILMLSETTPLLEYGLASIQAVALANGIWKATGINVPLQVFYDRITLKRLAEYLESREAQTVSPVMLTENLSDRESRYEPFEINDVQQAYLIGRRADLELGGVACHYYIELEAVDFNHDHFEKAWMILIERHETLRSVFRDGKQQILEKPGCFQPEVTDWSQLPLAELEARLAERRDELSHQVFDPETWPLFGVTLTILPDQRTRIHLSFDLLILDWYGIFLLAEELEQLYCDPYATLPPISHAYRTVFLAENQAQREESLEKSLRYWRRRLPELPGPPQLALAKDPCQVQKPTFVRRKVLLNRERWETFKSRAQQNQLTPSAALLSAFGTILARWSQKPGFTLTMTMFGKSLSEAETGIALGDFTNVAYIGMETVGADSFLQRSQQVLREINAALDHKGCGAIQALRELSGVLENDRFPVVFTSVLGLTAGASQIFSGLGKEVFSISQTPQIWLDHQVVETTEGLHLIWDYVSELFPEGMIEDMQTAYLQLLQSLTHPEISWHSPAIVQLPQPQRERRNCVNLTQAPVPNTLLHELFMQQARAFPDAPAVICAAGTTSYARLNQMSSAIAKQLQSLQVQPNTLVAVGLRKGWLQVAAVLGILKAGAAYLPLDPDLPFDRRELILKQAQAAVVLVDTAIKDTILWPQPLTLLAVDTVNPAEGDAFSGDFRLSPDDLAYVIFTSGSTGTPKGVMISHRGAANTIVDLNARFTMRRTDRALSLSALNFDLSVYDIFGILACGGTIVMPDPDLRREPSHWHDLVSRHQVTLWNTVPALMQMYTEFCRGRELQLPDNLRLVWLSGDWIPVTLPEQIRALQPTIQVISLGGSTEASIWSGFYQVESVDPQWKSIPYGKPLQNQTFHIYDYELQLCPDWVPGRLYIGGSGLAIGYWKDPQQTAERFIVHPETGERIYWTGDLGKMLPDGNIEFLGREDFQVKIRGYRIELEEIEAVLHKHPAVQSAAVAVQQTPSGMQRLVAYIVAADGNLTVREDLHAFAASKLPDYMVPGIWTFLESLPLSANGKVDRKALPEPIAVTETLIAPAAVEDAITEQLMAIWKELLHNQAVTSQSSFFELGGDSFAATRLTVELEKQMGVRLKLGNIFEYPKLSQIADLIRELQKVEQPPVAEITAVPELQHDETARYEPFPLTDVQYAYWVGRSKTFELGNASCQGYMEYEALGLDPQRFEDAWRKVLERHDMLRATIRPEGTQVVQRDCPGFYIPVLDLSRVSGENQAIELEKIRAQRSHLVLPTDRAPMFAIALTKLGNERWQVHFNIDLLVMDFWSYLLLEQELREYYENPVLEKEPLRLNFRDCVLSREALQSKQEYQNAWRYWEQRCQKLPPAPQLPVTKALAEVTQPRTQRYYTVLKPEHWQMLRDRAQALGITPTVVVLTVFADVLKLWSSTECFTLNLTLFNREGDHPQLNQLIGDFTTVNLLAMDYRESQRSFIERARDNQRQLWEDLDHKAVGGVKVLRELSKQAGNAFRAIMPVVFTSTLSTSGPLREPAFSWLGRQTYMACQTPQVYFDHQVTEDTNGLHCSWDIVEELFPAGMIEQMREVFERELIRLAVDYDAWKKGSASSGAFEALQLENQVKLWVVDSAGRICPDWVEGRLVMDGEILEAAEQRFQSVEIPAGETNESRQMVFTGLLACRLPDGTLRVMDNGGLLLDPRIHQPEECRKIEALLQNHPEVLSVRAEKVPSSTDATQSCFKAVVKLKEAEILENDPLKRLAFKLEKRGVRREASWPVIGLEGVSRDSQTLQRFVQRRSYRNFRPEKLDLAALGRWLVKLSQRTVAGYPLSKQLYSSAGGLYPVQVYLYVKPERVTQLEGGIYYYHPVEHALQRVKEDVTLPADCFEGSNVTIYRNAAFAVFLIADLEAIEPIYGSQARDFCLMEAGIISHLLESEGLEERIGLCQIGALPFERMAAEFALKPSHLYLHCLLGGLIATQEMTAEALTSESAQLIAMLELLENSDLVAAAANLPAKAREATDLPMLVDHNQRIAELQSWFTAVGGDLAVNCRIEEWTEQPAGGNLPSQAENGRHWAVKTAKTSSTVDSGIAASLRAIFQEILKIEHLDETANFFDIGGNSLLAVQASNLIYQRLGIELSVIRLFEYPTLQALSSLVGQMTQSRHETAHSALNQPNPSSGFNSLQERMQRLKQGGSL